MKKAYGMGTSWETISPLVMKLIKSCLAPNHFSISAEIMLIPVCHRTDEFRNERSLEEMIRRWDSDLKVSKEFLYCLL